MRLVKTIWKTFKDIPVKFDIDGFLDTTEDAVHFRVI